MLTGEPRRLNANTLLLARMAGCPGVFAIASAVGLWFAEGSSLLFMACLFLPSGPLALLCGWLAQRQTRWRGPATAWLGLWLGGIAVLGFALLLTLVALIAR